MTVATQQKLVPFNLVCHISHVATILRAAELIVCAFHHHEVALATLMRALLAAEYGGVHKVVFAFSDTIL